NQSVSTIALHGGTLYVGGAFTTINGVTRRRIAALTAGSGVVTDWNPNSVSTGTGPVNEIEIDSSTSPATIYAGGSFSRIGGQVRSNVGALDAATGAATSWNPGVDGEVYDLLLGPSNSI